MMAYLALVGGVALLGVVLGLRHQRAHHFDARWRERIQSLKGMPPLTLPAVVPYRVTRRKLTRKKVRTAVADLSAERAKRRR